jgi:hypothetical protein
MDCGRENDTSEDEENQSEVLKSEADRRVFLSNTLVAAQEFSR